MKLIVAIDNYSKGIGYKNKLVLKLDSDLKEFYRITTYKDIGESKKQNVIIMGKNTYKSIPTHLFPLKNRINVVLSTTALKSEIKESGALIYRTLDECIEGLSKRKKNINKIFCIGGSQLYKTFLKKGLVDEIYLSRIKGRFLKLKYDTFLNIEDILDKEFNLIESKSTVA